MEVAGGSARGALEIRLVSASVPQQSVDALRASLAALAGGSRRGGAAEAPLRRHEVQLRLPRRRPDAPLHALTLCRDVTDTAGGGGEWTVRQVRGPGWRRPREGSAQRLAASVLARRSASPSARPTAAVVSQSADLPPLPRAWRPSRSRLRGDVS